MFLDWVVGQGGRLASEPFLIAGLAEIETMLIFTAFLSLFRNRAALHNYIGWQ
jgi:hypothetical protein